MSSPSCGPHVSGGRSGDLMILMWSLFLLNAMFGYRHRACGSKQSDGGLCVVPISGTELRADYYAGREYIADPVYTDLITKVCFMEASSTGKTTFARTIRADYRRSGATADTLFQDPWLLGRANRVSQRSPSQAPQVWKCSGYCALCAHFPNKQLSIFKST